MAETRFDLIVIGGGPGGYVAAIRAAQLGLSVAVVEREHLGGICLNWGCIPTKALLRAAEVRHMIENAETFGIKARVEGIDLKALVARSRKVAGQLSGGIGHLMKKNKVTVIEGQARLDGLARGGKRRVAVESGNGDGLTFEATNVILATGARARTLPGLDPDGTHIVTYREAMVPETLPKTLLVIGSGAIGMEFASFYADLGVKVTVVEVMDRILPVEDEEISALAAKAFKARGIDLRTGTSVASLKFGDKAAKGSAKGASKGKVQAEITSGGNKPSIEAFDRVILAVGIVGNTESLGLEGTRVRVEKGHVVVNGFGETGEKGVYAIGDLAGPPWLAHKASHEGVIAVEHLAGHQGVHPLDPGNIPGCTYCRPQIASVGMTEAQARAAGHEVRVGRFPFIGNGKALAMGEPEGLVKTVFDATTGALLGAHMIGAEVTEMIQGFALARTLETTEAELMQTVFPHPTISEAMHESVLDAYGRVLHL